MSKGLPIFVSWIVVVSKELNLYLPCGRAQHTKPNHLIPQPTRKTLNHTLQPRNRRPRKERIHRTPSYPMQIMISRRKPGQANRPCDDPQKVHLLVALATASGIYLVDKGHVAEMEFLGVDAYDGPWTEMYVIVDVSEDMDSWSGRSG